MEQVAMASVEQDTLEMRATARIPTYLWTKRKTLRLLREFSQI
jgi:hypothetical protein